MTQPILPLPGFRKTWLAIGIVAALMVIIAACGDDGDDGDDIAIETEPTPTEAAAEPTPTPEPAPAEDVDLAPELAGLTDWRDIDPVTLEDLRGGPVVLVFWNSM